MILLDTDHISVLQFDSDAAELLKQRLKSANQSVAKTVITLEQQQADAESFLKRQWYQSRLSSKASSSPIETLRAILFVKTQKRIAAISCQ